MVASSSHSVSGTDYIYMNSAVYRNGTSFVESLFETFGKFEFIHDVVKKNKKNTLFDFYIDFYCVPFTFMLL